MNVHSDNRCVHKKSGSTIFMNTQKIEQHLHRICQSEEFHQSESYQELLRYLVSSSLEGNVPKEATIAVDLFGKHADYNPSEDSTVRTHIYGLRKKLEKYYLTQGQNDDIRFVIPKGHYQVLFEKNKKPKSKISPKGIALFFAFLSLISISYFAAYKLHQFTESKNQPVNNSIQEGPHPIFNSLVHSSNPLLFVIGDYYIYGGGPSESGGLRKIRDGGINSDEDFYNMLNDHPHLKNQYHTIFWRHTANGVVLGALRLLKWFSVRTDFEFRCASQLSQDDLDSHDIVFLGPFKTLRKMDIFFQDSHFSYQHYPHKIFTINSQNDTTDYNAVKYSKEYYYRKDFAVISKRRTKNNHIVLVIASFSSASTELLMQELFSPGFLNRIRLELLKGRSFPREFEMLFEINFVEEKSFLEPVALHEPE